MKNVEAYWVFYKNLFLCVLLVFVNCIPGCSENEISIYNNKSFDDIQHVAERDKKPFCIVLMDSSQHLSKQYLANLQGNYKYLTQKAIYNIVDMNAKENIWYMKWLMPPYIPLTCIFSFDGQLLDVIPGMSKETFLYSDQAITHLKTTEFHWPSNFHKKKEKVVPYLNQLLVWKKNISAGVYKPSGFNNPSDSLNYPYAVYLKLAGALMLHDSLNSIQAAKALLELEDPGVFDLYKDEFMTAKKLVNPGFDLNTEANIRVDKALVSLKNCKMNEKYPFSIIIHNDGKQPLIIKGINLSCTCLSMEDHEKEIIVKGKGQRVVSFNFTPNDTGKLSRDIFINSNAINTQILHINVQANVN